MDLSSSYTPIGFMRTCFKTKNGTPRQGCIASDSRGVLTIEKSIFTNPEHSLQGLQDYNYVWILFSFHLNNSKGVRAKVKPPRLDGAKLGVFATRSPHRPNPIGLTLAKLEKVDGPSVTLSGLDIVDNTPILDIKPYIQTYDMPQSCAASNAKLKTDKAGVTLDQVKNLSSLSSDTMVLEGAASVLGPSLWSQPLLPELEVMFTRRADMDIAAFSSVDLADSSLEFIKDSDSLRSAIIDVLRADPRSTYRRNRCSDRLYYFTLDKCHVTAWFDYSCNPVIVEVLRIKPLCSIEKMCLKT